ncbi:MAG: triple tyrosine motif-containing protein [Flavobacteriaceae bacterium]
MKLNHLITFFILFQLSVFSQELPPIEVFKPKDYGAEDQNWGISQDTDKSIYFANNKGLLAYNGARWKLYKSPNSSIIRSVKVIDGKIYTGCYMDFGYWEKNEFGVLNYTSLVKKSISLAEDEEFWNILALDQWMVFQSLDRIYIYNTADKSFKIIKSKTTITKIYKVKKSIYFQKINDGIFKFEDGKEVLVTNDLLLKDRIVVNVFDINDELLFQTKENGLFTMGSDKSIKEWDIKLNYKLDKYSIYNSLQLSNGGLILGTVSNGILHVNTNKEIVYEINQSKGLGNNTILSLFEDANQNVWLGMDNGISNINFNAPFRVYKDQLGILGSVYTTILDDNILYLGTNQGLFYKDQNKKGSFNFVKGTEGQVWSLQKIKNTLFCSHDNGTFIISSGKAEKIKNTSGTWLIKEVLDNPNLLIQGNYNGLYTLKKENNKWTFKNKIKGFDISSRHIEFISKDELLISHEHKGVYRLKIDGNFNEILSYTKTGVNKSIKSSLSYYNNSVLYGSNKGVYNYINASSSFKKDSILSKLLDSAGFISGKLITANNKLFAFTNQNISYVQRGKLSSKYELNSVPIPNNIRETKDGYENILFIGDNKYLIGTINGYIVADLSSREKINTEIKLDAVSAHALGGNEFWLNLNTNDILENSENHIKISYSVPDYSKYLNSVYQYKLVGFNNSWSEWSSKSEIYFENLPYGGYTFEARAKIGDQISSNSIIYNFSIEKPWHLQSIALIIYLFSTIIIILIIHFFYTNYYKNQRKKLLKSKEKELEIKQLENEQQLMHYKNLDLQKDIDSKNRELGLSTMNLIKRNELLSTIKKELSNTNNLDEITKVIKLINKNLNTSDDWKLFEEAFKNTDKGFIKKIKSRHDNLTSNDLRLCTYLRLNLSSKEIAPLLNISIRSVEVKRYRLRKKMNLPHEASLSSYILQI